MLNDGSDVRLVPSLALITMPEYVPTCDDVGVPVSAPLAVLKFAQAGRFVIDQVSVRPSGSEPVGRNAYALPAVTEVGGVPLNTGARLVVVPPLVERVDVIENGASEAVPVALLTLMRMFDQVAGVPGTVPSSLPEYTENTAHDGLLTIE
jgi:hypothetical protein